MVNKNLWEFPLSYSDPLPRTGLPPQPLRPLHERPARRVVEPLDFLLPERARAAER